MIKINKNTYILAAIVILAFFLRAFGLRHNLFFGWEQGRDFIKLKEIASGNLTLVGPKTDIDGVFHGALSYYIPLIPFVIFAGSPFAVIYSYLIVHAISIVFLFLLVSDMFSKKTGYLAAFIYAISYSSIIYAGWLSNPNLVPAFAIFFIYFLWKSKQNWKYLMPALISWLIIFHLTIVVAISFIIPSLYLIKVENIKLKLSRIFPLAIISFVLLSPYIVFEIKNNFLMTRSFLDSNAGGGKFWLSGIGFIDQFISEVVDGIFPLSPRLAFIIFMSITIYLIYRLKSIKQSATILIFLFSMPILFLFISNFPLRHFFITVPIFLSIIIAVVYEQLVKQKKKNVANLLLIIIVLGNAFTFIRRIPRNEANFIHHSQRTYIGDMENILDWVYQDANKNEFTYDYYSVPYWKEDAWMYLFDWYGKNKYGYVPEFDRTNQQRSYVFYTIIEPNEAVPVHLNNWYGEYKKNLDLIETYQSGLLKVEKRREKVPINEN